MTGSEQKLEQLLQALMTEILHNRPMREIQFEPPEYQVTMMFCDHANVAEGKVYVNGGVWT